MLVDNKVPLLRELLDKLQPSSPSDEKLDKEITGRVKQVYKRILDQTDMVIVMPAVTS